MAKYNDILKQVSNSLKKLNEEYQDDYDDTLIPDDPYDKITLIRKSISDETIVDELIQYMSTDELNDFTDQLIKVFDLFI